MLERQADWDKFLSLIGDHNLTSQQISRSTGIGITTVEEYRDQLIGLDILEQHGEQRADLAPYAIAFRYARLGRWIDTGEIKHARKAYDEGQIELCTAPVQVRGRLARVLYAIPRRVRNMKREPYFSAPVYV